MKQNYLSFITAVTDNFTNLGRGLRLRLKQLTILGWCVIVIAFLCSCVTGPMRQGLTAPIYNALREPYAQCKDTIGLYMAHYVQKGYRLWSGPEDDTFQTRFLLPPRKDFNLPRQYIILSKIENPAPPMFEHFEFFGAGVCDTNEITVYFFVFQEVIQELEAAN